VNKKNRIRPENGDRKYKTRTREHTTQGRNVKKNKQETVDEMKA
jgi:hypothetical protein